MKATVVCGVLGAGKTTYLQNILQNSTEKAVVLVNDFGDVGIDGEILASRGVEAIRLPSGCVCCTLKTDLMTTLGTVTREFRPDHVFIEPSGVATPSGVLESLAAFDISPISVVGIVDATTFVQFHEAEIYGRFFEDQITSSDVVLVNKTDLTEPEMVDRTVALIGRINERAVVVPTVRAVLDFEPPASDHSSAPQEGHSPSMQLDTFTLRSADPVGLSRWERLFERLAKGQCGIVRRAKALVQTDRGPYRFDLSSGRVDVVPFGRDVPESWLVVIGEELQEDSIRDALKARS